MSATPYQIWVFDCPQCSGQTSLGEDEPFSVEDCLDCGESIRMGSPDWDQDSGNFLLRLRP